MQLQLTVLGKACSRPPNTVFFLVSAFFPPTETLFRTGVVVFRTLFFAGASETSTRCSTPGSSGATIAPVGTVSADDAGMGVCGFGSTVGVVSAARAAGTKTAGLWGAVSS